jgi:hypothetical protein
MALRNHAACPRHLPVLVASLLLAAGCVFPVETAPGDGTCSLACTGGTVCFEGYCINGSGLCGLQTCSGCCSGDTCLETPSQDGSLCGLGGEACHACSSGVCSNGVCSGPGSDSPCRPCTGCCDGTLCFPGDLETSCGSGGLSCNQCQTDELCVNHACTKCSSANCNGCCDTIGDCLSGDSNSACGSGGTACALCSNFTTCIGNVCQ